MKKDYTTWKLLLVYLFGIMVLIGVSSCGPQKPDLVDKNGKEFSILTRCVKSHTITEWKYHYGFNPMSGKFEMHWGWDDTTICDESVMDTIEINIEKKYYTKK